ncbi:unnamed protein product [Cylindrotheca closterium]|uniref:Uncharacterized protein n=1 Tax=Cylindrotheca closterium TaxID=2856 RepID=A0AAD2CGP4_9STRA|nr:unnamed protein product [Cylindrotheca closterium]
MIITTDESSIARDTDRKALRIDRRKRMGSFTSVALMDGHEHQNWKQKLSNGAGHLWQKNKVAITSAIAAGAGSAAGSTVASFFASSALISGFISATVSSSASIAASSVAAKAAAAAREQIGKKTDSANWKTALPSRIIWEEYHDVMPYF